VVLVDRRQRTGKGGEGRPEELEAEKRRKQSFSGEAEVTGSGAEAGRSTSQEETNPAGHGGRGRGGYAQEARRASEGDIGAQRASGKVRDSGFGDRTCREGASSECSLAWDRSDLLRGPWENSLEERQDPLSSDVCLFSPERKEGSGGVERDRVSEESDLCSPVRRRCGGYQIVWGVDVPGSDSIGKVASGATHEPESEEETQIESEAITGTTQQGAQGSALQGGGTGPAGKQAIVRRTGGSNQPAPPVTQQSAQGSTSSRAGNWPTAQSVGGGNQPVLQNRAVGMAMIKFRAPPTFSGKQGEDAAD
jgi:hypothetical protein